MEQTIEQKVAETILQDEFTVKIGDKEYKTRPISYGTLIRVSALISTLPSLSDEESVFAGALKHGTHAAKLAEIVALCVLNRKDLAGQYRRDRFFRKQVISPGLKELKEEILYNCTIGEIGKIVRTIFNKMELSDFFGVMVSLSAVNVTAETKTTASGQPLEA